MTITTDPAGVDADAVSRRRRRSSPAYNGTVDALRTAIGERPDPAGTGSVTKGAFYADGLYTDLLANLNRAVSDTVAGLGSTRNQAATVGLSSGAATGAMAADSLSGRLVLDESKLREALAADPDGVAALLGGDAPQGIAARLDSVIAGFTGSTGALGGRVAAETARLGGYRASIDQAGVRLTQRESLLRSQFTAMERSLGQLRDMQSRLRLAARRCRVTNQGHIARKQENLLHRSPTPSRYRTGSDLARSPERAGGNVATGYQAYQTNAIHTAPPEQLVVMLYDGCLRFLRRAEAAAEAGERPRMTEGVSRATAIIMELNATLDMERGGEIAGNLRSLYFFLHRHLIDASREGSARQGAAGDHAGRRPARRVRRGGEESCLRRGHDARCSQRMVELTELEARLIRRPTSTA